MYIYIYDHIGELDKVIIVYIEWCINLVVYIRYIYVTWRRNSSSMMVVVVSCVRCIHVDRHSVLD